MSDLGALLTADEPPAAELAPTVIAWREIPLPPLPKLNGPVVIAITTGELWCCVCGNDGATTPGKASPTAERQICWRCGSAKLRPAADVLRADEYCYR